MNGATLRAIRTTCGYTIDHFANLVKVAGRTLSRWELDARDVPADVAFTAESILADYREVQDDVIPQMLARGEMVGPVRHDDPVGPPHGFDLVLWNAAVSGWAVLGNKYIVWAGDEDEDEEVEG